LAITEKSGAERFAVILEKVERTLSHANIVCDCGGARQWKKHLDFSEIMGYVQHCDSVHRQICGTAC
jgi:hypothetical protein